MEKDKIIQLIEQELVQADEANSNAEFEKHIYAIHTLTSLVSHTSSTKQVYSDNSFNVSSSFKATKPQNSPATQGVSEDEIRAMGGKVSDVSSPSTTTNTSLTANKLVTDDEVGNGDSIFDF
ncbi:DUF5327 family protein [Staphylococcus edaphicus]|uniref:YwdI family protein n=1 Tax=Staphylococcus edaphicus TaxID=1955013 RepID=A0A2C6U9S7_9STAP|nr:DUF5327 family protein [Staphylococcus edaphicus]PHK50502.1 hypothetical protein BTJ66_03360 [Staphylococcus edaphicus]UQW81187.1 YwdI family protein [Staphylococcus edaphicus]